MMSVDRILEPLRALIYDEVPGLGLLGLWEYSVTGVNADGSVNGEPTTGIVPLPPLNSVPCGALVAGGVCAPTVGTRFLVEFRNVDGARYAFVSADTLARTVTLDAAETVNVGPSASNPVPLAGGTTKIARSGDQCTAFWPQSVTLTGTLIPPSGGSVPLVGNAQILGSVPCLIVYGNEEVRA
jgi:hypothetical protein